jgi:deoxyribodipyrimidine photo-lyase
MSSSPDFSYITSFDPVPSDNLPSWMLQERTRVLNDRPVADDGDCIVYWMQRDVRTVDNWGLLLGQELAFRHKVPLRVIHVLHRPTHTKEQLRSQSSWPPTELVDLPMTERYGTFLLGGLECVHKELEEKSVPFHVVHASGGRHEDVIRSIEEQILVTYRPKVLICDMSPIRHVRQWTESPHLLKSKFPVWQVDSHNVVPVWYASPKREVGARTLRSKLNKLVDDCLQEKDYSTSGSIPEFTGNTHQQPKGAVLPKFERMHHEHYLQFDTSVKTAPQWKPGTTAALQQFDNFVDTGLKKFAELRNDPNQPNVVSSLSPHFNFGHLAFATCLRTLKRHNRDSTGKASFVEEGFVRKELSDNLLWYSPRDYDKLTTAAGWAQETLETHSSDEREYLYSLSELETGQTHDDLWNASQIQLTSTGKLHGFLRMYWAKKILEWTESPTQALSYAQYFNDYYALDGRDPNGFVGVGWSIMGIHDQGWAEREVFGKIRFMNYKYVMIFFFVVVEVCCL